MKTTLLLGGLGVIVAALWFTHTFWGDLSVTSDVKMTVLAVLPLVGSAAVIKGISLATIGRTQKIGSALLIAGPAVVILIGTLLHASARGGADIGGIILLFCGAVSLLATTPLSIGFVLIAERQNHP